MTIFTAKATKKNMRQQLLPEVKKGFHMNQGKVIKEIRQFQIQMHVKTDLYMT